MKDYNTLLAEKRTKEAFIDNIIKTGKADNRKLSETENTVFNNSLIELREINRLLDIKNAITTNKTNTKTMNNKFSLVKAIEARANGRTLDETANTVIENGKNEMRNAGLSFSGDIQLPFNYRAGIISGGATTGQEFVSEDKIGMIEPIRDSLVLVQAGAEFLTGLTGDVSIPSYTGTSALWKGETATATDGAGTTGEILLSPKRLTTFIDVSKQFLAQNNSSVETMLLNDIVNAITLKLEQTIFGTVVGSTTQPAGFFATAPTVNGVATFANVVAAETSVDTANLLKNGKYITQAGGRAVLKTTVKAANTAEYLMDKDGTVNGYPCLISNSVAKNLQVGVNEFGVVFGDWSQFIIGQWGAIDLVVDGTSQAIYGNVRIVVNAYFDAKPRNANAFKTISIK